MYESLTNHRDGLRFGMEVHLTPDTEEKVARAAVANESTTSEYIQQLVETYVDHDLWFREQVKKGLDQLDRGEYIAHEELKLRLQRSLDPK